MIGKCTAYGSVGNPECCIAHGNEVLQEGAQTEDISGCSSGDYTDFSVKKPNLDDAGKVVSLILDLSFHVMSHRLAQSSWCSQEAFLAGCDVQL